MNDKQIELHCHIYQNKLEDNNSNSSFLNELFSSRTQEKIISGVKELPYPCNVVIEKYFLKEVSSKQIMQDLRISNAKFYSLLHKGKFLLRKQLNPSFYQKANEIMYGARH